MPEIEEMRRIALAAAFDGAKSPKSAYLPVAVICEDSRGAQSECLAYLIATRDADQTRRGASALPSEAVYLDALSGEIVKVWDLQLGEEGWDEQPELSPGVQCGCGEGSEELLAFLDEARTLLASDSAAAADALAEYDGLLLDASAEPLRRLCELLIACG